MLGQLVEFLEKASVMAAVVVGAKGERLQIVTENEREMTLSPKRLLPVPALSLGSGKPRAEMVKLVRERSAVRDSLAVAVKAAELWELLQGEGESFDAAYLAELTFGDRAADHVSAVFRALFDDRLYFRIKQDRFQVNSPEEVQRIIEAKERAERRELELSAGAVWLKDIWEGRESDRPEFAPALIELLRGEAIWGRDFPRHADASELLARAGLSRPEAPFELMVRLGLWSPDENLEIVRLDIPVEFSEEVEAEAARIIIQGPVGSEGREDLRDLWTVTIDGPGTRDFDDALSIERTETGFRVAVHITDVIAYIGADSRLEREALERGTTLYLPEGRIPMLPPVLSEDVCSLKLGQDRPAVTVLAEMTSEGALVSMRVAKSMIRVHEQITYEQADQSDDERIGWIFELSRALRENRLAAGALILPLPEINIRVDDQGQVSIYRLDPEQPSRVAVSEMMILANWLCGRALSEAGQPAIYRRQEEPRDRLVQGLTDDIHLLIRQCRQLARAEWSSQPGPHSSLGLTAYTSITSPIRRAVDLLVQRQLTALLAENHARSEDALLAALARIEEAQGRKSQLERRRCRYWLLKYLEAHREERFEALVVGEGPRRLQVLLTGLMLETDLPKASGIKPGEKIAVRIQRVSAFHDALEIAL